MIAEPPRKAERATVFAARLLQRRCDNDDDDDDNDDKGGGGGWRLVGVIVIVVVIVVTAGAGIGTGVGVGAVVVIFVVFILIIIIILAAGGWDRWILSFWQSSFTVVLSTTMVFLLLMPFIEFIIAALNSK